MTDKKLAPKEYMQFSGPHWANYIAAFSKGEAVRLDEHYEAGGALMKTWTTMNQANA
jgi:hypothetical protein